MSLQPRPLAQVPEQTMLVARAAFPKGSLPMSMRDQLGEVFVDERFAVAFGVRVRRRPRRAADCTTSTAATGRPAPPTAADRCLDCPVESGCPYSGARFYRSCLADPDRHEWPLSVVTRDPTPDGATAALRDGPYGRCVYAGGNDVADHQSVTVSFAGGATATLTMSAFTPGGHRRTRIMGTQGYLEGDGEQVSVTGFVTGATVTTDTRGGGADAGSGHGGGDMRLMAAFVEAVATGDRSAVRSGPWESLDSHRMAFAAEHSRLAGGARVELATEPVG
ncbi:hypothetical protein [Micromonospora sp. NPDC005299]|uniref:Gfo/Idh/MocA family protein n=1 Tax=Micromonospora sp. NPDC005299 TaxID=3364231 RepID=UPI0036C0092A